MLPPKGSSQNNGRGLRRHSKNILRDAYVGTSIYFRGQANKVVAESKANRLDPQIWKIAQEKGSIMTTTCKGVDKVASTMVKDMDRALS